MIPAPFEYHAPSTVKEAIGLLERYGDDAKLLAGGHSLLPIMKFRLAQPKVIVDIGRIPGLDKIEVKGSTITIGALVTHDAVEQSDVLQKQCPLLPETAAVIGDMQVRNRGTIGGSLAHADPAADYPGAILALDAEIVAAGPKQDGRVIPAKDFFVEMLTTALAPNEVITAVRVPVTAGKGTGTAYLKHPHPASGYAVVGVAVVLQVSGGKCQKAAIGVNGVAGKAYRASAVEAALVGKALDEKTVAAAAAHAADGVDVQSDLYASSEFRAHLASVYTKRAVLKAASRPT